MTIIPDTAGYRLRITRADGSGEQVLDGSFPELMTVIPDSVARQSAEGAIRAYALAKSRETMDRIRSDDLDRREATVAERERQDFTNKVRSFADAVAALEAKVDALEQRRIQAALDSAPDPDDPRSHSDNLRAPLPPSEPAHEERLAAMSAERPPPDAEDALDRGDDQEGSPSLPAASPRILAPQAGPSDLPEALADSVVTRHGFTCRRDYKAWKRQMRGVAR
jgi:hypothetical protein